MTPQEACRILGIEPGAGPEAAQEAYRKAALRTHPDRAAAYDLGDGLEPGAAQAPGACDPQLLNEWLRVRDAYECLRRAGFPAPAPAEPGPRDSRRAEPRRYRAPEWLERQWANEKGERITDFLRLDEHERAALRGMLLWLLVALGALALAYRLYRRAGNAGAWRLKPGVSVRW